MLFCWGQMLLICVQVSSCDKALRVYPPISLISLPLLNTVALIYLQIQTLNNIFIKNNQKRKQSRKSVRQSSCGMDLGSKCLVLAVSIPLSPLNNDQKICNNKKIDGLANQFEEFGLNLISDWNVWC